MPNAGARRDPPANKKFGICTGRKLTRSRASLRGSGLCQNLIRRFRIGLLGGAALVMMVESTDFANLDHLSFVGRLYSPGLWGILGER